MKKVLLWLVRLYRKNRPAATRGCCRFYPTCSAYALEAIEVHGAFWGSLLSVWRILRCNPLCKGGYDPVPPKKSNKNKD